MPHLVKVKLDNPKILTWAREELELTEPEVGNRFNKHEDVITSWETGEDAPTFRQLTELAKYYKRPLATFFLPDVPSSSPKPTDHRILPGLVSGRFSKDTLVSYREVHNMVSEVSELLEILHHDISFSLPTWTINDDAETQAEIMRTALGVSIERQIEEMDTYYTALDIWRSFLFDRGVFVRICRMPIEDARAFCLFRDKLSGIGLSNEDREHGKISSLFHEVCHLSLNKPGVSGLSSRTASPNQELEQYCDKFSASFLLPSSHHIVQKSMEFLSNSLTFENTRRVASKFKVSKYVVIRRALDLGFISPDVYWNIYNDFQRVDIKFKNKTNANRGGNYYATQISYNGKRYVNLVMEALHRQYLTSADVKRLTGLTPANIELSL